MWRVVVLVLVSSVLVSANSPVFTNYPRAHTRGSSLQNELTLCGETDGPADTFHWELLDKETDQYEDVASGPCLSIPGGLGITRLGQLGDTQSITYRICASNADGTTCFRDSRYTVTQDDSPLPGATYRHVPVLRRSRHTRL